MYKRQAVDNALVAHIIKQVAYAILYAALYGLCHIIGIWRLGYNSPDCPVYTG